MRYVFILFYRIFWLVNRATTGHNNKEYIEQTDLWCGKIERDGRNFGQEKYYQRCWWQVRRVRGDHATTG